MANSVTIDGRVYHGSEKEPELKFTAGGTAMIRFSLGYYQGKEPNGETKPMGFIRCTAFGELAENIAESIGHGDNVVVSGKLEHREWVADGGDKRSETGLVVWDIGASLRWNTVTITRTESSGPRTAPAATPAEAPF